MGADRDQRERHRVEDRARVVEDDAALHRTLQLQQIVVAERGDERPPFDAPLPAIEPRHEPRVASGPGFGVGGGQQHAEPSRATRDELRRERLLHRPDRRVPHRDPAPRDSRLLKPAERFARLAERKEPRPLPGDDRPHQAQDHPRPGFEQRGESARCSREIGHTIEPAKIREGTIQRARGFGGEVVQPLDIESPQVDGPVQPRGADLGARALEHGGGAIGGEYAHAPRCEMHRVLTRAAVELEDAIARRKRPIEPRPDRAAQGVAEGALGEARIVVGREGVEYCGRHH